MYMYMHMHMHMDMCVCTHISPDGHRQTHSDLIREFAFCYSPYTSLFLEYAQLPINTVNTAFSPQKPPILS